MKKGDLVRLSSLYAQGPGRKDDRIGIVIDMEMGRYGFNKVDVMWPPPQNPWELINSYGTYNPVELEKIQ